MKEYLEINRKLWDHWADLHPQSDFYDAEAFRKNPMTLHEIEMGLLPELAGKKVLHMQCHFGQDTISFKTLGAAEVWGLDFSPVALRGRGGCASAELGYESELDIGKCY